jgi:inhibitor of cysteine peptidase
MADHTVTAADNGRGLDVSKGDSVAIRLYENASTGYRWTFDGLDDGRVALRRTEHQPGSDAVGSGGYVAWVLEPTVAGRVEIRLKLWRPWEGDGSIRDRFSIALNVR